MAARLKIIVLEKVEGNTWRCALWADVPVARQAFYANPSATSAWKDALAGDLTALRDGSVVEKVDSAKLDPSWTVAQMKAELEARATAFQTLITASNPWTRYGSTFDGASWVNGGVA